MATLSTAAQFMSPEALSCGHAASVHRRGPNDCLWCSRCAKGFMACPHAPQLIRDYCTADNPPGNLVALQYIDMLLEDWALRMRECGAGAVEQLQFAGWESRVKWLVAHQSLRTEREHDLTHAQRNQIRLCALAMLQARTIEAEGSKTATGLEPMAGVVSEAITAEPLAAAPPSVPSSEETATTMAPRQAEATPPQVADRESTTTMATPSKRKHPSEEPEASSKHPPHVNGRVTSFATLPPGSISPSIHQRQAPNDFRPSRPTSRNQPPSESEHSEPYDDDEDEDDASESSEDSLIQKPPSRIKQALAAGVSTRALTAVFVELCREHKHQAEKLLKNACQDDTILSAWVADRLLRPPQSKPGTSVARVGPNSVQDSRRTSFLQENDSRQTSFQSGTPARNATVPQRFEDESEGETAEDLLARFKQPRRRGSRLKSRSRNGSRVASAAGSPTKTRSLPCAAYHEMYAPWSAEQTGPCNYHPGRIVWRSTLAQPSAWSGPEPSALASRIKRNPEMLAWTCCEHHGNDMGCHTGYHPAPGEVPAPAIHHEHGRDIDSGNPRSEWRTATEQHQRGSNANGAGYQSRPTTDRSNTTAGSARYKASYVSGEESDTLMSDALAETRSVLAPPPQQQRPGANPTDTVSPPQAPAKLVSTSPIPPHSSPLVPARASTPPPPPQPRTSANASSPGQLTTMAFLAQRLRNKATKPAPKPSPKPSPKPAPKQIPKQSPKPSPKLATFTPPPSRREPASVANGMATRANGAPAASGAGADTSGASYWADFPPYCDGMGTRFSAARKIVADRHVRYEPRDACGKCRRSGKACLFSETREKCALCCSQNQSRDMCQHEWARGPGTVIPADPALQRLIDMHGVHQAQHQSPTNLGYSWKKREKYAQR